MKLGNKVDFIVKGLILFIFVLISLPIWLKDGPLILQGNAATLSNWKKVITLITEIIVLTTALLTLVLRYTDLIEYLNERDEKGNNETDELL